MAIYNFNVIIVDDDGERANRRDFKVTAAQIFMSS